ncbi:MAG: PHP domain-containing protein [Candidatus Aminicenantales bacterium]
MRTLRRFKADLHIHTCLSPCGELTIYPRKIVERALEEGLALVAVTDHNSGENAAAVQEAARGTALTVFPGMEITSEEEVHILAVFETVDDLVPVQSEIFRKLPGEPLPDSIVKDQVLVNAHDEVTGFSRHCLMGAVRMSVPEVVSLIHGAGGLAIAAHIDREAFSLISQLGFIPPGLDLDALEVSPLMSLGRARTAYAPTASYPLVRFSDAHKPDDIGRPFTEFLLAAPAMSEIRMALRDSEGRRVIPS